jgi:hypothetical protein
MNSILLNHDDNDHTILSRQTFDAELESLAESHTVPTSFKLAQTESPSHLPLVNSAFKQRKVKLPSGHLNTPKENLNQTRVIPYSLYNFYSS